ncbi:MAG: methylamine utilization protein [Pseudomonadales bacterium]
MLIGIRQLIAVLLLSSSQLMFAIEFTVVDQHGKPLSDAVVELLTEPVRTVAAQPAIMDQKHRRFAPRVLAIRKGRQVALPNSDNVRHHVYSFSPAKTFEIKLYKGVPGAPMKFDTAGLVTLGCNIHDGMIGYIYVAEHEHVGVSNESGTVSFDTTASSPTTLRYWHPDQLAAKEFNTMTSNGVQLSHIVTINVAGGDQ